MWDGWGQEQAISLNKKGTSLWMILTPQWSENIGSKFRSTLRCEWKFKQGSDLIARQMHRCSCAYEAIHGEWVNCVTVLQFYRQQIKESPIKAQRERSSLRKVSYVIIIDSKGFNVSLAAHTQKEKAVHCDSSRLARCFQKGFIVGIMTKEPFVDS